MVLATNLGFPRIGAKRELKKIVELFWAGEASLDDLQAAAFNIRRANWTAQRQAGISHIPCHDFSAYDHMLDMTALVGAIPKRYGFSGQQVDMATYFAMARGNKDVPAMEMTKWFDTNYHYIVPEFDSATQFRILSSKLFDEVKEAQTQGFIPRPVLIGPITFLALGKDLEGQDPLVHLPKILSVYTEILQRLKSMGVEWVQLDEPLLVTDLTAKAVQSYRDAYAALAGQGPKILLATYFEGLRDNSDLALSLPIEALHIDLCRAPDQIDRVLSRVPKDMIISLGVVDGRNVWRTDIRRALGLVTKATNVLGKDRVWVAPSCSLLHSPIDLDLETKLDVQFKSWLAFAKQKLEEVSVIVRGINQGMTAIEKELIQSDVAVKDRKTSPRIHDDVVQMRLRTLTPMMTSRQSVFSVRRSLQQAELQLPSFPTTTIGSFPQTQAIRQARASFKKGDITLGQYQEAMKSDINDVVRFQEEIGLDVLVHGEPERNDMVEYFGEQLKGFMFSQNGWVQSYGSRCVKPPIVFGDVSRPQPMTVAWSLYAQSRTTKPLKGMLTGPITMLFWSFVRDDQPRADTCRQIALALRDEVADLEDAGIKVIQIDEPAIREGLPLRNSDRESYLNWAVECFKLASCVVGDATQIHTHMCYSEFNDVIDSIAALDADSISMETSRSHMELLEAFIDFSYPNDIGPGVYDIHSPRIPSVDEMVKLLEKAALVLKPEQIWVNPDCGLKTRKWDEVKPALQNMVAAAKIMRTRLAQVA